MVHFPQVQVDTLQIAMASDTPAAETSEMKKSKRVRKKRLYAVIMEQMEFYFSDANLTRDKYLRALMENDKCKTVGLHTSK